MTISIITYSQNPFVVNSRKRRGRPGPQAQTELSHEACTRVPFSYTGCVKSIGFLSYNFLSVQIDKIKLVVKFFLRQLSYSLIFEYLISLEKSY